MSFAHCAYNQSNLEIGARPIYPTLANLALLVSRRSKGQLIRIWFHFSKNNFSVRFYELIENFFWGFKHCGHRAERRRSLFMVNWFLLSRLAKVPWGLSVCLGWACFDTDSDTATSKKFLCADLLWLVLKYDQSEAMCQTDTDTMRQKPF